MGGISYLTNALKTGYAKQVNFEEDWKLLTILIGANNICEGCKTRYLRLPFLAAFMRGWEGKALTEIGCI